MQEAAVNYYGVNACQLDENQVLSLVFTIKCPNYYNQNVYADWKDAV